MNFVTAGKKNACNLQIIMFYLTFLSVVYTCRSNDACIDE